MCNYRLGCYLYHKHGAFAVERYMQACRPSALLGTVVEQDTGTILTFPFPCPLGFPTVFMCCPHPQQLPRASTRGVGMQQ